MANQATQQPIKPPAALPNLILITLLFSLLLLGHNMALGATPTMGEFRLQTNNGTAIAALMEHTRFTVRVDGILARVEVEQVFHNPTADWVEGEYVFPLSNNAAVDYMEMVIGNRRIVGKIREKQAAKKIYQDAKKAGKKASLVSQQRPNLFTNQVANIAPGETIRVTLRYLDTAQYDHGHFRLRLPTTLTPRYEPGDRNFRFASTSNNKQSINRPMTSADTAAQLSLTATINAGIALDSVKSLYQPAQVQQDSNGYTLTLEPGAQLNQDVVVEWIPTPGQQPVATAFRQTLNGDDYLALMLLPPQQLQSTVILPRETIFVIDTSGSMGGVSINQAQAALKSGLAKLQLNDRFNVIEFNSSAVALWAQARPANIKNIDTATAYVNSLRANGGTNMTAALQTAFTHSAPAGYVRQVVFITDGSVSNEAALFEMIHRQRGNSRLFTVGIGSAPNSHFMEKAATSGRGSFTYIGAQHEIQARMSELFQKLQNPVLTDIAIDFGSQTEVERFPQQAPDLYAGEPLMISAKIAQGSPQYLTVSGQRNQQAFQQSIDLTRADQSAEIGLMWARKKLSSLYDVENQARFNGDDDMAAMFKAEITQLALNHQLLSKYTSFVAVEEQISRSFNEFLSKLVVPNAMPKGNTMAVPVPQGGLGLGYYWLLAAFSLLILFFLARTPSSITKV